MKEEGVKPLLQTLTYPDNLMELSAVLQIVAVWAVVVVAVVVVAAVVAAAAGSILLAMRKMRV